MPKAFTLSVVAPDKSVVDEQITSLVAPGSEGYFGVQADHLPLIAALRPGLLEYTDMNGQRRFVYVGGGFAEVRGNRVMVLADEAEMASKIDAQAVEQHLEAARRALRGEESSIPSSEAVIEVERAIQRLRAVRAVR